MFGRRKRDDDRRDQSTDDVYRGLRALALNAVERGPLSPMPGHPSVAGFVVDILDDGGSATIVALSDDTASMYTSGGGGVIGAGAHRQVVDASRALLREVEAHIEVFDTRDDEDDLPAPGQVRLHVLTPDGRRRADVSEAVFWGRESHALTPVIIATQHFISRLREVSPT